MVAFESSCDRTTKLLSLSGQGKARAVMDRLICGCLLLVILFVLFMTKVVGVNRSM